MTLINKTDRGPVIPGALRKKSYNSVVNESSQTLTELQNATPLVKVDGVTLSYGNKVALQEISLTLFSGKRVAIVGPNGAGKSSLLKMIAGEVRPRSGQVSFCGFETDAHVSIAYVPQHKQIDWNFPVTVEEVVMMGRIGRIGLFRWARQHDRLLVHQSLEQVGMDHLAKTRIGALSGGQQQRVFIARALAQEATMLLLDEPLSGLDIPSKQSFLDILEHVTSGGVTIIMATHDLTIAQQYFDQVVLLNKQLVASGPAKTVLSPNNLRQAFSNHLYAMTPMFREQEEI